LGRESCASFSPGSFGVGPNSGSLPAPPKANPLIGKVMGRISASVMLGLAVRLAWSERR
jgi:hypothetical protein